MLYQLKVSFSAVAESATEGQWIIVDSDGEEVGRQLFVHVYM